MKKSLITATCAVPLAFTLSSVHAQDGTLDTDFGTGGWVSTDVGFGTFDDAKAVVVQPDGKILVAGTSGYSGTQDLAVVRYLPDGTVDDQFGTGGRAIVSISPSDDLATALALQPDGAILVGGYAYLDTISFALVRFTSDGEPDATFGNGGVVVTNLEGNTMLGRGLAVQADGKILFAGGGEGGFAVVRYDATGALDPTYDGDGLVLADFGADAAQANAIALQSDGFAVVAGYSVAGTSNSFAVARIRPEGVPDPDFGTDGLAEATLPSGAAATGLAIRPDGKIMVVGTGGSYMVIARFTADGHPDLDFFGDGIAAQVFSGLPSSFGDAVVAQADGKTLAAGYMLNNSTDLLLVRLEEGGLHDVSFGTEGMVSTDLLGLMDTGHAMAVQPDGKVIVAGTTDGGNEDWNFVVARYNYGLVTSAPALTAATSEARLYPDPMAPTSFFDYSLEESDVLSIDLLDARGLVVQRLLDHAGRQAGPHTEVLRFDASLAPGAYLVRLVGNTMVRTLRVVK